MLFRSLDDTPHAAYIDLCRKTSLIAPPKNDELRVVYTPLQGVGGGCAGETLIAAGFKLTLVKEQNEPDGQFLNVTKTPNPEVRECMDRAEKVARDTGADLIIATDPDADRIGGMACTSADGRGDYRFLTGQEIAALLTHFKLSRLSAAGGFARIADRHHHRGDDRADHPHRPAVRRAGGERDRKSTRLNSSHG